MKLAQVRELVIGLDLPDGDYALHGSAPLLAHGLIEEVNDVDIVCRGAAWQKALTLAPREHGEIDDVVRPAPGIELFDGWLGDDANELIDAATLVAGLPCVTLEAVLRFKLRLGRPKDEAHIRLLEAHLHL